jgi:hypothetical protein
MFYYLILNKYFRPLEGLVSTYPYGYNLFTANTVNCPILLSFICDDGLFSFMIIHVDSPYDTVQQPVFNTFPLAHQTSEGSV